MIEQTEGVIKTGKSGNKLGTQDAGRRQINHKSANQHRKLK
jgi:hypothetical protein